MSNSSAVNFILGDDFSHATMWIVACSPDNDIDRCMPIGVFRSKSLAEKYRDACDKYDEKNFHHIIEIPYEPDANF
jgi:hypothetical protein